MLLNHTYNEESVAYIGAVYIADSLFVVLKITINLTVFQYEY